MIESNLPLGQRSSPDAAILVTGVAGFLGSNLLACLLQNGHKVVGIDDLSMGSLANVSEFISDPDFTFHRCDITSQTAFQAATGVQEYNCIVHLAAKKIPRYGAAIDTLRVNFLGTDNVLKLGQERNCKVVLASTSDVYGRNPVLPFSEDTTDHVIGSSKSPRWAYAVSKLFDEHLALAYADAHNFPVTLLRIFGSYGPKQPLSWWGGPPPVFIDHVLRDTPVPIHGDGSQTRSFTYVTDTVAGIYAAISRREADNEIINIGSQEEVTILDLAHRIKRLSNTPGELNYELVPYSSFTGKNYQDVMRRVPDISRSRQLLGVEAGVTLDIGLTRTIEWQRDEVKQRPKPAGKVGA